jgi:hypothetical protein
MVAVVTIIMDVSRFELQGGRLNPIAQQRASLHSKVRITGFSQTLIQKKRAVGRPACTIGKIPGMSDFKADEKHEGRGRNRKFAD